MYELNSNSVVIGTPTLLSKYAVGSPGEFFDDAAVFIHRLRVPELQ